MLQGRISFPLLMPGRRPNARPPGFTERVDSVLLATSSFWQGIDVPGESLSCLLIDKLPFEVRRSVTAARLDRLARNGKTLSTSTRSPGPPFNSSRESAG